MFGVGSEASPESTSQPMASDIPAAEEIGKVLFDSTPVYTPPKSKSAATYIAPGTVMEGTLREHTRNQQGWHDVVMMGYLNPNTQEK